VLRHRDCGGLVSGRREGYPFFWIE
jgi:hypothetical protein